MTNHFDAFKTYEAQQNFAVVIMVLLGIGLAMGWVLSARIAGRWARWGYLLLCLVLAAISMVMVR